MNTAEPEPQNTREFTPQERAEHRQFIAARYREMILGLIEEVCARRVAAIEGAEPTDEEVREHGHMQVTEESGIALYLWKGIPMCEYVPAGQTLTGWRNASVKELTPVKQGFKIVG